MNTVRRRRKHALAQKSPDTSPTPFELAHTAIALCQLRKEQDPSRFFGEAEELLAQARSHLQTDREELTAAIMIGFNYETPSDYQKVNRPIPFSILLRSPDSQAPQDSARKKRRTWIGSITTQNGLEKAVRRYFPPAQAVTIIKAQAMQYSEWQHLLAAQKAAIATRASTRVNPPTLQKNKSA